MERSAAFAQDAGGTRSARACRTWSGSADPVDRIAMGAGRENEQARASLRQSVKSTAGRPWASHRSVAAGGIVITFCCWMTDFRSMPVFWRRQRLRNRKAWSFFEGRSSMTSQGLIPPSIIGWSLSVSV